MVGNHGAGSAKEVAEDEASDARAAALSLMSKALEHLDSDTNMPAIIGARLQSAIDALWIYTSSDRSQKSA
ncbi:MAG TPA: hypothetical protein VEB39_02735 [Sphingomicrobium sp.]|nr:hypothetical protein [Sphingomicrobium sp.]